MWLTTDVAKQLINILQAGVDKIESGEYIELNLKTH